MLMQKSMITLLAKRYLLRQNYFAQTAIECCVLEADRESYPDSQPLDLTHAGPASSLPGWEIAYWCA